MKSFIYTFKEGRAPRDGSGIEKTVRIYRIKRGIPECVAGYTDTFMSEFQMVMVSMEHNRLLPKAAFERNQFGGYKYGVPGELRRAGFANVNSVG